MSDVILPIFQYWVQNKPLNAAATNAIVDTVSNWMNNKHPMITAANKRSNNELLIGELNAIYAELPKKANNSKEK